MQSTFWASYCDLILQIRLFQEFGRIVQYELHFICEHFRDTKY